MTLEEARKLCERIREDYKISHCEYLEEQKGESVMVYLRIKLKVDKKTFIDKK